MDLIGPFFRKLSFWTKCYSIVIDTIDHIASLPTIVIAGTPGSGHCSDGEVILLMDYSSNYHVLMDLIRLQSPLRKSRL